MKKKDSQSHINRAHESLPFLFTIELGQSLVYLLKTPVNPAFVPSVNRIRDSLVKEWGVRLPPFLIRENPDIPPDSYRFELFNQEILSRSIPPGKTMVITREENLSGFAAPVEMDPIYDRPCIWIESGKTDYRFKKEPYTATTGEVILEHLETVLRTKASEFITMEAVKEKLAALKRVEPAAVKETLDKLSLEGVVELMKNLVPEGIPFTMIDGIVKTVANTRLENSDPDKASEVVRNVLKDNIHNYVFRDRLLLFASIDSRLQLYLYKKAGPDFRIPEDDPVAEFVLNELINLHLSFQNKGFRLGVICAAPVRLILRRILEKNLPWAVVLKPEEVDPGREIMIVKKLKMKDMRIWLHWAWFWLTAPWKDKKRFSGSIKRYRDFIKKKKQSPPGLPVARSSKADPNKKFYKISLSKMMGKNLPAPLTISARQKAAIYLSGASDEYLNEVFKGLSRDEALFIATEMASLPGDTKTLRKHLFSSDVGNYSLLTDPFNMVRYVKSIYKRGGHNVKLSPLQKLAVLLSALPPQDAEKMYQKILSKITSKELEGLAVGMSRQQVVSLQETRRWAIDDFLWFVKSSYYPAVLYSRKHWTGELQRMALRNPQKFAAALRELWLSSGQLQQRFDHMVKTRPEYSSYWIRRYVINSRDRDENPPLSEKAYVLLRLLPGELRHSILKRLDFNWRRIFDSIPGKDKSMDPVQSGTIISQFLSHYHSAYEKGRLSEVHDN